MSVEKPALVWCETCQLEFPEARTRCPFCRELHRNEPRPETFVRFLFRNLSDKATPVFRIYRDPEGVAKRVRRLWKVVGIGMAIFSLMAVNGIHQEWKDGKGVAGILIGLGVTYPFVLLLVWLMCLREKNGRPVDVLADGTLRLPLPGRAARGVIGLTVLAVERAATRSTTRNYAIFTWDQWRGLRLHKEPKNVNWFFVWGDQAHPSDVAADVFPKLDEQLPILASALKLPFTAT